MCLFDVRHDRCTEMYLYYTTCAAWFTIPVSHSCRLNLEEESELKSKTIGVYPTGELTVPWIKIK